AGVDDIYAVGGAQAVAALAYGTESIPKVDKIVGPGNVYVAAAKKLVSGSVGIDLQAGPTEILILADDTANPRFVASDLISQAEHDPNASCFLVTVGDDIVDDVVRELYDIIPTAPKRDIIEASIENNGLIVVCPNLTSAINTANAIAVEHLELMVDDPLDIVGRIDNAGAIFLGPWTPVAVGDYIAGPSHTLPTSGTARFSSPLTTDDFVKKSSVIYYSFPALIKDSDALIPIADSEGFRMHARSVEERIEFVNSIIDGEKQGKE
ncbi:MAG: histidinol dehydrogenase, partial [Coriobacteriales bacterium]